MCPLNDGIFYFLKHDHYYETLKHVFVNVIF